MECFVIVMLLWVFSVCLHEYGHAKVAHLGGDYSVVDKGYLSMNPMRYAHPFMSFVLPVLIMMMGCLALPGGAVYLDRSLLRSKKWDVAVSLAGPAMNLLLAIIIAIMLRLFFIPHYPSHIVTYSLAFVMQLQISAFLFNLIPIPPLDGFHALGPFLKPDTEAALAQFGRFGILILFVVFQSVPMVGMAFWSIVWTITAICGIDPEFGLVGMKYFRFWLG